MNAHVELQEVNLRGIQTSYLCSGSDPEKPILLCLHGFPDDASVWNGVAEIFSDSMEVIRPYSRGVAPSAPAKGTRRYGVEAAVLDWLELLRHLDPKSTRSIFCVGHDLGAVQMLALAPLLGTRLKGVAVIDGLSLGQMAQRFASDPSQIIKSWYIGLFQLPYASTVVTQLPSLIASKLTPMHATLPRNQWKEPIRAYQAMTRDLAAHLRRREPRLAMPLLVLWGDQDPYLARTKEEEWEVLAQNVTIRVLPCGHWPQLERPIETARYLREFFGPIAESESQSPERLSA